MISLASPRSASKRNDQFLRKLRARIGRPTVCGTFGKGLDGSVSINFGLSGGRNCDASCAHHPESIAPDADRACYAAKLEFQRASVRGKLSRHEAMPAYAVCGAALLEIQTLLSFGHHIPWVRFSVSGSVPKQSDADRLFRAQLRTLVAFCRDNDIPIHFPVESSAKARFYREVLGELVAVRESAQSPERFVSADGPVSVVATGKTLRERLDNAHTLCAERREATGRKSAVCPAITSTFRRKLGENREPVHCGKCTLCANPLVDIVYPLH